MATPAAPAQTTTPTEDQDFENPFFEGGELNDIDEEAAERLFAESIGEPAPKPTKEPAAEVLGGDDDGASDGDDDGIPDLEEPSPKSEKPAAKKDDPLKGLFGKPKPADPNERKQENKGLRSQARDLAQQREQLQAQLDEKDQEIERMRQQLSQVEEERSTYQRGLSQRFDVGKYDPTQDPEIKALSQKLNVTIKRGHLALGSELGPKFEKHAETLAGHYNKALESGDVDSFYALVEQNFPGQASLVVDQVARVSDALAAMGEVQSKNQQDFFKNTIGGWEDRRKANTESASRIGGLTREEAIAQIDSDENATNAIISLVAQNSPDFAKVLKDIQARAATFTTGVRPFDIRDARWERYLDPTDPTQLSEEGKRLRDTEIFNHQRSQEVLPIRLAEGMAAAKLLPAMARKIAALEARLGDDQGGEIDPDLESDGDSSQKGKGFHLSEEDLDDPGKLSNPYLDEI